MSQSAMRARTTAPVPLTYDQQRGGFWSIRGGGGLLLAIAICHAAGLLGVLVTDTGTQPWYQALRKPSFNPPNRIFAPVWLTLYTMMGTSLWLLWRQGGRRVAVRARNLFWMQLLLNAAWTPVFFGLKSLFGGLVVIVAMVSVLSFTIRRAWPASPLAALLLVPYWVWIAFATVLNLTLWWMNRGAVAVPR